MTRLPMIVEKALLQSIEKTNLSRDEINLLDLCEDSTLFGDSASELRRDVQKYFCNIKRRSIRSYSQLLDRFHVPHGAATARLLRAAGRCPSPNNTVEYVDEIQEDVSNTTEKSVEKSEIEQFGKDFEESARITTPTKNFEDTIVNQNANSPFFTPLKFSMYSPAQSVPSVDITDFSASDTSSSERNNYLGSLQNPWPIAIDLKHPERHLNFDVRYIPRTEHNGWAREAIDIRTSIGVGDNPHWAAWMDQNVPNEFKDRVIIIKGRSRSSSYDETDQYHRKSKSPDLLAVDEKTKQDLENNPSRLATYYKLISPFKLDNVILSGDSQEIKMEETGIKYNPYGNKKIDCKCMFVSWTIAKKNSGYRVGFEKKQDYSTAFD